MKTKKILLTIVALTVALPGQLNAQLVSGIGENMTINVFIGIVISLLENILAILVGLAVFYFLFGLVKYVRTAASDDKTEATGVIMNGIIILFVMTSIWGLVAIVSKTFIKEGGSGKLNEVNVDITNLTQ